MSEHPPAGWYADPTRRFDHRYWDGGAWTDHVSRAGQATRDPVAPSAPVWQATTTRRMNVKAVVSLVLSILWVGGLGSAAGLVLGVLARRELRHAEVPEGGDGLAVAGIVIGALGLAATLLAILAFVALVTADVSVTTAEHVISESRSWSGG